MKKLITVSLSVLVGAVLGVILVGSTLRVRAVSTATQNGDVNGDGTIDVSDAVYTLFYLFKGGEPPVACADSTQLVGRVADLEERVAKLEPQVPPCAEREDRFTDNGDGTVTDKCSGLMWQQVAAGYDDQGGPSTFTWLAADQYCKDLRRGGYADWRLPNLHELAGLGEFDKLENPPVNSIFFVGAPGGPNVFWTASVSPGTVFGRYFAWTVKFTIEFTGAGIPITIDGNPIQFTQRDEMTPTLQVIAVRGP